MVGNSRILLGGFKLHLKQLPQEGENKNGKWWADTIFTTDSRGIVDHDNLVQVMVYDADKNQYYQAYSEDQIATNLATGQQVRCPAVELPSPLPNPIKNTKSKDYVRGNENTIVLNEDKRGRQTIRWFASHVFEVRCEAMTTASPTP